MARAVATATTPPARQLFAVAGRAEGLWGFAQCLRRWGTTTALEPAYEFPKQARPPRLLLDGGDYTSPQVSSVLPSKSVAWGAKRWEGKG